MPSLTYSLRSALWQLHFTTPRGVYTWCRSFMREGVTLMTLFAYASSIYPHREAIIYEGEIYSYERLYRKALALARLMYGHYGLKSGNRVALLCRNHVDLVLLLPALSRLGVGVHLLNTDMSREQVANRLLGQSCYDLLIIDEELTARCLPQEGLVIPHITIESLKDVSDGKQIDLKRLPRVWRGAELAVLTGGSSGTYKEASRRPSALNFLPPLLALIRSIGIHQGSTTYVALPLYHGFGLATLLISLVMGKRIWLTRRFRECEALRGIDRYGVDVLPIVPVMLARMMQLPEASEQLKRLRCIISGGDRLDRKLVAEVHRQVAPIIYNLYGTSEAGFFLLATPSDLDRYPEESTLGYPIRGVQCDLRDKDAQGVGVLWVRSRWAMQSKQNAWQSTGDRMFCDADGFYFHRGRADRMVVCAGENVYPELVERTLEAHPEVVAARVYAVESARFGNVLEARVELLPQSSCTESALLDWLRSRLSRSECPHAILFGALDILSTGKRA